MDVVLNDAMKKLQSLALPGAAPVLFIVGAGVSIPSGLPTWGQLANDIADALAHNHPQASKFREAIGGMRPEVMLQALYRTLGSRGIDAIRAMDPHRVRQHGVICEPNTLHLFLAEVIKLGHILVTTNFDDLVEEAAGRVCPVVSSQSEIVGIIPDLRNGQFSGLIKLHGTFRNPHGNYPSMLRIVSKTQSAESLVNLVACNTKPSSCCTCS